MLKLAALGAALFSCLAVGPASASTATSASAAAAAQPPSFTVRLLTANGSGCPHGTAKVSQPSNSSFTVRYSQFVAASGGGAPPIDFRKNCQLDTLVGIPAGWTVGVGEVDYRGHAHLGNGARGMIGALHYFAGQQGTSAQSHQILGPADRNYAFNDKATVVKYSACGTSVGLNINTQLLAFPGAEPSYLNWLSMDSTKVSLGTVYHLVFKRC